MNIQRLDTLNPASPEATTVDYSDFDLRPYIRVLFLWWREIVIVALVTAIIGAAFVVALRAMTPPVYETSADVIMDRVVSNVNLVDSFTTTTEGSGQATSSGNARREALVHLVKSGAIAEAVIADLDSLLSEDERMPAILLRMVEAEAPIGADSRTISDLIRIKVKAGTPEKAEAIANSWTKHYITHINSVYNQVPVETFASFEQELQQANENYIVAQQALETFIGESRIDELQNQIVQKTALRTNYLVAQTWLITNVVEQDRAVRLKLFTDLVSAQTRSVYQVFNSQVQERVNNLSQLYRERDLTQRQLTQAQNLRQQVEEGVGAQAAGTRLALQLLKTQVYATVEGGSLPGGLTVDISTLLTEEASDPLADVVALITTLETYSSRLDGEIDALSEQLLAGDGYNYIDRFTPDNLMIATATQTMTTEAGTQNELATAIYDRFFDLFRVSNLAQLGENEAGSEEATDISMIITNLNHEIQTLQASLAAEQSKELLVTQQRDLMLNTYNTLNNKVVELTLARTAANTEVRLGSPAIAPLVPVPGISLVTVTLAAGVLGWILAILGVIIANLLGRRPWLTHSKAA